MYPHYRVIDRHFKILYNDIEFVESMLRHWNLITNDFPSLYTSV